MANPNSSIEIKYKQLFINNEFVDAASGKTFATVNPSTGEKICDVAEGDKADVDRAVVAALAAFQVNSPWRKLSAAERGRLLFKLANLVERDQEYLAILESLDAGKLHCDTKVVDLPSTVEHLRYYAGYADKIYGKTVPTENDFFTYTRKEPIGVCGAILPWNFPLVLLTWKVGPALATGNCIIVKPSENTALTTLYFASLVKEAGFPPGVFQVIPGFGTTAGTAIAQHMDIRKVSFTGSTKIGKLIQTYAAQSNLKRVSLELGGKSPNIILEDADLDYAVAWSASAVFFNTGQCCTAGSRTFVHESIYDEFVKRSAEKAKNTQPGDVFDSKSNVGPVVNEVQMKRVLEMIESGKTDGAKLMCGGARVGQNGYFIQQTIFADVTDDMRVAKEEIFGPVQQILKFRDIDEVIERANKTNYGLAAGVFTKDINKALKIAHGIQAGTVWVNCYNLIKPQMPFGGYKESGIGREMSEDVFNEYTETKSVMVKLC